jgi:protein TonB
MSYQSLLFCPDEKTARVVTQVLTELEFSVELCTEPFATVKRLMAKQYDAVVVDCDNEQNAALLFKSARNSTANQASLAVAVVEGQAGVAKAFRIGANLVLTKPVNVEQSKGTLRVARGLLRKAEAGKPGGTPLAPVHEAASAPATTSLNFSKGAGAAVAPPRRSGPAAPFPLNTSSIPAIPVATATSATFEVDQDPTPQMEVSEAAFLQSIPEPVVSKSAAHHAETSHAHNESPWPKLDRSVPESRGLTLKSAVGVTTDTNAGPSPAPAAANSQSRVRRPFSTGLSAGQGIAAAPARERTSAEANNLKSSGEGVQARPPFNLREGELVSPAGPAGENDSANAPAFGSAANEVKASKIPLIAALVLIAVAGAGYLGWGRMKMVSKPPVVESQPTLAQPQPSPAMPTESVQSEIQNPAETVSKTSQSQELPKLNQNPPPESRNATSGKTEPDEIVVVENSGADSTEAKPLSVKKPHEALPVKTAPAAVEQTIAPPAVQLGSNASDQTIAGLISSTSLPIPERAPEVLRVSQGITEGMLVKRVNPVYPSQAIQMHRQGTVQIVASIGKNGLIARAKVVKGDPVLGDAAITAVKQWKYKPYTLNGQPVEVQTQISVNFKLPN